MTELKYLSKENMVGRSMRFNYSSCSLLSVSIWWRKCSSSLHKLSGEQNVVVLVLPSPPLPLPPGNHHHLPNLMKIPLHEGADTLWCQHPRGTGEDLVARCSSWEALMSSPAGWVWDVWRMKSCLTNYSYGMFFPRVCVLWAVGYESENKGDV